MKKQKTKIKAESGYYWAYMKVYKKIQLYEIRNKIWDGEHVGCACEIVWVDRELSQVWSTCFKWESPPLRKQDSRAAKRIKLPTPLNPVLIESKLDEWVLVEKIKHPFRKEDNRGLKRLLKRGLPKIATGIRRSARKAK